MQPAELLPSFCNSILLPHLKSLQYKLQYHYQSLKNTSENQYGGPPSFHESSQKNYDAGALPPAP